MAAVTLASAPAVRAEAPAKAGTVPLFDNLGTHHHPIKTRSKAAQQYFDQGLRLAYGFNHDEAERAFREAARLDPTAAMPWWGVALVPGPNYNLPMDAARNAQVLDALAKARARAKKTDARERAYVEALAARYSADPKADRAALDRAYATAMAALSRRYPDDLDAATLYAESLMNLRPWKLWNPDGTPAPETSEILSVLESVLKREPNHPGANHYYIHATEASNDPGRALPSAERLKTLVPGAGHLVHMPAHTFIRTGDYLGAAEANAVAARVDEAYMKRAGSQGVYPLMYYNHNLHFLAIAAAMAGQSAVAREPAARVAQAAAPLVKEMPMAEFLVPTPYYVAARFQRWDEALAFPEPQPAADLTATRALRHWVRGVALAARGDVAGAEGERRSFQALREKVPADAAFNINATRGVLDVADAVLEGRIASARGDVEAALAAFRKGVAAEETLTYDEPPAWYYPVRESLGGELLRRGRAAEAEAVFREDLRRNPRNGRSLFGLWKSLEAQGRAADAATVRGEFEQAWKAADVTLRVEDL
jgi:tetratricopeptide (TPR) repeat protein